MKVFSLLIVFTCFSIFNCASTGAAGSNSCSISLTDAYRKVDLPALIGLWCELSSDNQDILLQALVDITGNKTPSTDAILTLWDSLEDSQQQLMLSTFIRIGLLPQGSTMKALSQPAQFI
jgi:hypothetical protein